MYALTHTLKSVLLIWMQIRNRHVQDVDLKQQPRHVSSASLRFWLYFQFEPDGITCLSLKAGTC